MSWLCGFLSAWGHLGFVQENTHTQGSFLEGGVLLSWCVYCSNSSLWLQTTEGLASRDSDKYTFNTHTWTDVKGTFCNFFSNNITTFCQCHHSSVFYRQIWPGLCLFTGTLHTPAVWTIWMSMQYIYSTGTSGVCARHWLNPVCSCL